MPTRDQISVGLLNEWASRYETSVRTIRRWLAEGEQAGEPCPLHDPEQLKAWWARHKKWRVPDAILRAAEGLVPAGVEAKPSTVVPMEPIDISEYDLAAGEAVAQARKLVAVAFERLKNALAGAGGDVDSCTRKYEQAQKILAKAEADHRAARKADDEFVSKVDVQRDLATALEMLRQMTENRERRVIECVPSLTAEQRAQVASAIRRVGEQEAGVFRMLPTLRSLEDVPPLLAA